MLGDLPATAITDRPPVAEPHRLLREENALRPRGSTASLYLSSGVRQTSFQHCRSRVFLNNVHAPLPARARLLGMRRTLPRE
jgi:hypothetical protein